MWLFTSFIFFLRNGGELSVRGVKRPVRGVTDCIGDINVVIFIYLH